MHKISQDISKWKLDTSELNESDLMILKMVNFPVQLGYKDAIQKRITRQYANGSYIDKQIVNIEDIKYVPVSKDIAFWDLKRTTPKGNTAAELAQNKEFINNILKSKAQKFVYYDAGSIQEEMEDLLSLYAKPKPTPSMDTIVKPKPTPSKKTKGLTKAQKVIAKEKFLSGEMDLKELAKHLKTTQAILKPYLKTLNE